MTPSPTSLPSGTWTIDPNATTVTATAKMMKLIDVPATFDVRSGTITIVDGRIEAVHVVLDAASYSTGNAKRDNHVTSPDFFDADNHPTFEFKATAGDDTALILGQIARSGQTTPASFEVSDLRIEQETASFIATATVDRAKLGITKMPPFVIGNEIVVSVEASATLAS